MTALAALRTVRPEAMSPADREAAIEASRVLSHLSGRQSVHVEAEPEVEGEPRQTFVLPAGAVRLLAEMLVHLGHGRGVVVMPSDREFTTQEAADMLNVSRPYLVRLLEEKKIEFHKTGTHRRIKLEHLLAYERERNARADAAMDELVALGQEIDAGY